MTQVSKYPLHKEVYNRIFELLLKSITGFKDEKEAAALLKDLFSPTERIMLGKRLAIAVLLSKGYTFREIQDILRVSQATIATVNVQFKYTGRGYKKFAEKIAKEKAWEKFWEKIEDITIGHVDKREKGSGIYVYLQEQIKKERKKKTFF